MGRELAAANRHSPLRARMGPWEGGGGFGLPHHEHPGIGEGWGDLCAPSQGSAACSLQQHLQQCRSCR